MLQDLFPNDEWLTLPQVKALAKANGHTFGDPALCVYRNQGCPYLPGRRVIETKDDPRRKRWNLYWKQDVLDIISVWNGEAAQPAGRVYLTRGEMRAMGINVPKNLTSHSDTEEPRGWRIRPKPGDDGGEERYHVGDVKDRIEVLNRGYSSGRRSHSWTMTDRGRGRSPSPS